MKHYFTKTEIVLWSVSTVAIVLVFLLFDRGNYMTLAASVIGVTSLIFNAKGNPIGQQLLLYFLSMISTALSAGGVWNGGNRKAFDSLHSNGTCRW